MKKTLDAKDVGLLKHLLEMELAHMSEKAEVDIAFFMGVDGRVFSSNVPMDLTSGQFALLTMMRGNLPYICQQLNNENMKISVQEYNHGTVIITGVGENAFIASLIASDVDMTKINERLDPILKSSMVIKHIFELRPIKEEELKEYPQDVADELRTLARQLFKEKFTQTKEYKKNIDILENIKGKIESQLGKGMVNEIVDLTFKEMGTQVGNMNRSLWIIFLETVITRHVKRISGDIIADQCMKTWVPEVEAMLRKFA